MNALSECLWSNKIYNTNSIYTIDCGFTTYKELYIKVKSEIKMMKRKGIKEGSSVAIIGNNSISFLVSILASIEMDCRIIMLQPNVIKEINKYLKELCPDYTWRDSNGWEKLCEGRSPILALSPGICFITSGSTGRPKFVHRTFRHILNEINIFYEGIGKEFSTVWTPLPLGHAFAFGCALMATLSRGGTLYVTNDYLPADVSRILNNFKPEAAIVVPFITSLLVDRIQNLPHELKIFLVSGAVLKPHIAEKFHEKYNIFPISQYGSTETGPICLNANPKNGYTTVGIPYPGVEIMLDEEKYINIKSPAMAIKYVNNHQLSQIHFKDGWFIPGDKGDFDQHGCLYIVGRTAIANIGGFKVSVSEVESVLRAHPAINECRVLRIEGITNDLLHAQVTTLQRDSVSLYDLKKYCAEMLPSHKIPQKISIMESLPSNTENPSWKS